MAVNKIETIKEVAKQLKTGEVVSPESTPPNKDYFEALMKQGRKDDGIQALEDTATKPSPMEQVRALNRQVDKLANASTQDLIAQAHDVIGKISTLKDQLATPNLELKGSVQNVLKNKLTHIDENLKVVMNRAGVEYVQPANNNINNAANPIDRFLGYLTNGQSQLEHLAEDVNAMGTKKELTPANMLVIQIKIGFIQQELEFFTATLNKALESTKTIMNVQV